MICIMDPSLKPGGDTASQGDKYKEYGLQTSVLVTNVGRKAEVLRTVGTDKERPNWGLCLREDHKVTDLPWHQQLRPFRQ